MESGRRRKEKKQDTIVERRFTNQVKIVAIRMINRAFQTPNINLIQQNTTDDVMNRLSFSCTFFHG